MFIHDVSVIDLPQSDKKFYHCLSHFRTCGDKTHVVPVQTDMYFFA